MWKNGPKSQLCIRPTYSPQQKVFHWTQLCFSAFVRNLWLPSTKSDRQQDEQCRNWVMIKGEGRPDWFYFLFCVTFFLVTETAGVKLEQRATGSVMCHVTVAFPVTSLSISNHETAPFSFKDRNVQWSSCVFLKKILFLSVGYFYLCLSRCHSTRQNSSVDSSPVTDFDAATLFQADILWHVIHESSRKDLLRLWVHETTSCFQDFIYFLLIFPLCIYDSLEHIQIYYDTRRHFSHECL